jgi:hypothetical protein
LNGREEGMAAGVVRAAAFIGPGEDMEQPLKTGGAASRSLRKTQFPVCNEVICG